MSLRPLLLPWIAASLLAACASDDIGVSATYDPLVPFPDEATWFWDDANNELPEDPALDLAALDPGIRSAVEAELAARGYRKGPRSRADFRISYQVGLDRWIAADNSSAFVSLSVLMSDAKTKRRVWLGFARAEVLLGLTPEERRLRLREAVAKMLAEFPPDQRGDR